MAAKEKESGLSLRSLQDELLLAAYDHIAFVLRPLPEDADGAAVSAAVESLRRKGYVHGPQREPNLTPMGVDAARKLANKAA